MVQLKSRAIDVEKTKFMKTEFGVYELYEGLVWISQQNLAVVQGTNISIMNEVTGELRVIAYVIRKNDGWTYNGEKVFTLDEIIKDVLNSFGWSNKVIRRILTYC